VAPLVVFSMQTGLAQNYSLNFDGSDDYVDIGSPDLGINTTATFSAWINPQAENGVIAMQGFNFSGNERGWVVHLGSIDWGSKAIPRALVWGSHDNSYNANNSSLAVSPALITLDQWQHIAVTKDGSEIKMYLNGELIHTESIDAETITYDEGMDFRLGSRTA
ncbi:uncharacterized protein METZ01_LOCUS247532, partial [marine metagenome]